MSSLWHKTVVKKKVAVFAPVRDEFTFTPVWLKYYSRFIPEEDIYFLDFGSRDLSYHTNVIPCGSNIFDAWELFSAIKSFHSELLEKYEWVIPTDIDEFLYHRDGLDRYIDGLSVSSVRAVGFNLIHLPDSEPDIDLSRPILEQRKWWHRDRIWYDKTILTRKTLDWCVGLHTCSETPDLYDENLVLVHLHKFDHKTYVSRHLDWAGRKWSDSTIRNNWNWHYRLTGKDLEDHYWKTEDRIVEIPEHVRTSMPL